MDSKCEYYKYKFIKFNVKCKHNVFPIVPNSCIDF